MPNWCGNILSVRGEKEEVKVFKNKARGKDTSFSLSNFIPMPKELKETKSPSDKRNTKLIKKYGFDNWFDWNIANWGVKWDIEAHLSTISKNHLRYTFDSPWAPPVRAMIKIAKQFLKLDFTLEYEEPGMCFQGKLIIKNGEVVDDYSEDMEMGICPHCKEESYKGLSGECPLCGEPIEKFLPEKEVVKQ